MAMRICPICKKEYDDDLGMICPYCGYVPEETEDAAAVNEIAEETEIIDESTESAEEEKNNKTLKIVAGVLVVILVALVAFLAYTKFIAPRGDGKKVVNHFANIEKSEKEVIIDDLKKFSAKDLNGTYSDENIGIYYTFTGEKVSRNVIINDGNNNADETENFADSAADSAAEPESVAKEQEVENIEYDGTYITGATKKGIRQRIIMEFIDSEYLYDDYGAYIEEKGLKSDDVEGYIAERKYEDRVNAFDAEKGLSEKYEFDKKQGYFNLIGTTIVLYDESGAELEKLEVVGEGLVNTGYYYKGKTPSKKDMCAVYTIAAADSYGQEQNASLRLYKDGYFIFEVAGNNGSYEAGTFRTDDKGLYVNIGGGEVYFYVLESGITNVLLTK
ncbi:MAG: hypothetical protein IKV88_02950 [Clostridia bacterium]|nr:hypothetical protein [Clostridia bacterium]